MNNADFAEWLGEVIASMNRLATAIENCIAAWVYEIERTLAPSADQVIELVHAVEEAKRIQRCHPHPPRAIVRTSQTVRRWVWSPLYGKR